MATADTHLSMGVAQSKAGHLSGAREQFDRSLDLYLNAPGGALAHPRLAESYQKTLEVIQLHEFEALAAGDGFTESLPEPAAIDELAALPLDLESASDEARRLAEDALRGTQSDLTITLNDSVLASIDLFQGPLRDWFEEALARGGRYLPRIRQVFASEGIPQDLAYVALVESAFKPAALSRAKAKGVWQFMPDTGRRFGLRQDWWVDERSNPEKSTRAAAEYLKTLYELFQDWNLALAAYNAGEGRILRSLDRYGANDFWALAQTSSLALETRNYVPMIHAAIVVAKAPDKYGFAVSPEPLLVFDTLPVKDAMDLRLIAECSGTPLHRLQQLNPDLRRLATPAGRTFHVKLPPGTAPVTGDCLGRVPPEKRVTFRTHVVSRGQSLASLARKFGSSPRQIAEANGLSRGKTLARGTELIIPIDPAGAASPRGLPETAAVPAPAGPEQPTRISYRVKAGDTLTTIASRYRTTVRDLMSWNRLRGGRIAAGHTLTVYTRKSD